MLRTLWNGRAGLQAGQNKMDIISNNIANVSTNGYKKLDVSFQDLVYEKMTSNGTPITSEDREGLQIGTGSKADKLVRNMSQGIPVKTGKNEDLAIQGNGYFRLLSVDENSNTQYFYTRDGEFRISTMSDGSKCLVNNSGYRLDIENFYPDELNDNISIKPSGEIYSDDKLIGKIKLYDFNNKDGLTAVGDNLFIGEGAVEANGTIMQGYLENSNVDMVKEITDMMVTQRAFQLNSKSITAADEMWQITNNLKGR